MVSAAISFGKNTVKLYLSSLASLNSLITMPAKKGWFSSLETLSRRSFWSLKVSTVILEKSLNKTAFSKNIFAFAQISSSLHTTANEL